ncbi:MAG: GNAT family N-acetyltransferase, partial [Chloroflexota bacterium]|nr:GNAT family N-acetyltransferase [Chloroflexota bacterium]
VEREALLARAYEALALPPTIAAARDISREVALHQVASPTMDMAPVQQLARPLTSRDRALLRAFQPNSEEYYLHAERRPLIGVIINGRLLSLAHSSRRTSEACELGITTLPAARRRGYALAATILWAASVTEEGLIPIYSALIKNQASLSLASAAGYRIFAHIATIK